MRAPALRVVEGHARAYRHTWKGSAVTTFANPVLFLLAMGLGLGTLVDRGQPAGLAGAGSYLAFLAPGLLAATAMQLGVGMSTWPVLSAVKWQRTYQAVLATPIGTRDLVLGHLGWVTLRLLLATVVFAAVMTAFGAAGAGSAALAVPPAVLTGLAFAAPVAAYAVSLEHDYALAGLFRFGVVPMFLFSGTFFPVAQLPGWLRPVAVATPLWHGVELARAAAVGTLPALPVALHVAYLLAWLVAGTAAACWRFERRLVR